MNKLFSLILLMVLLAITVSPVLAAGPPEASQLQPGGPKVPPERDVVLSVDEAINVDVLGHRNIQKWQRVIDGIIHVKNDYILKHVDLDTNKVILYEKRWRDIEFESVEVKPFEPPSGDYFWKKVVLFVDEEDLGFFEDGSSFYTFFDTDEYPLVCWEVRYIDGTTVMYDLDGNLIGYGIPAPSSNANGYLFSGYEYHWYCVFFPSYCNPWEEWRDNANYWYSEWVDWTASVFDPTTSLISFYVSLPYTKFYYAIAHGGSTSCYAKRQSGNEYYYRASQAYPWAYDDMENRDAMVFAFLGHCNAMVKTDYASFSDAFRKGGSGWGSGTMTVGYKNMGGSPAWSVSLDWQDAMFTRMHNGERIYYAWLYATYVDCPDIIGYVAWAGDPGMYLPQVGVRDSSVQGYVGNSRTAFPILRAKLETDERGVYVYTDSGGYYVIFLEPK